VQQRYLKTGEAQGNVVAIKKGLKVGEMVVTSGQNRLHSGMRVFINNSASLKPIGEKELATD